MGQAGIGSSFDAPPVSESSVIEASTISQPPTIGSAPPKQCTSRSTHDVVDAKNDTIAQFGMNFL